MCCVCSLVLALDVKYFGNNINIINNDDDDENNNNNKDVKTRRSVTSAPPLPLPHPQGHPSVPVPETPQQRREPWSPWRARRDSEVTVEIEAGAVPPRLRRCASPLLRLPTASPGADLGDREGPFPSYSLSFSSFVRGTRDTAEAPSPEPLQRQPGGCRASAAPFCPHAREARSLWPAHMA